MAPTMNAARHHFFNCVDFINNRQLQAIGQQLSAISQQTITIYLSAVTHVAIASITDAGTLCVSRCEYSLNDPVFDGRKR